MSTAFPKRLTRRGFIAGTTAASIVAQGARAAENGLRLTVMGQALIQHDLRRNTWPDFATMAAMFGQADLCFTDLETAIRNGQAGPPTRDGVFLHVAEPIVLDCLKEWRIGLLATANNHAFDLGAGGILGAIEELDRRGLVHAGTGPDLATAAAPAYCRTAAGTVALIAAASGSLHEGAAAGAGRPGVNELRVKGEGDAAAINTEDAARVLDAIRAAAAKADIMITYHHNHVFADKGHSVPAWQREFAYRCVEAGATLFVSHGAPWLLGIELYRGRPIFYDLGSLVFQSATESGYYDAATWQSVIAECRFAAGKLAEMRLVPVQLNEQPVGGDPATRGRPSLARGGEAVAVLDHLAALSAPFGTVFDRSSDGAMVRLA